MALIKGITVMLFNKTKVGTDEFNRPIYSEVGENIENVLVTPSSTEDIVNELNLSGKRAVYTLAIPKGDEHVWENRRVEFFGDTWRTIGVPIKGIEENMPLDWNAKVMVEHYE